MTLLDLAKFVIGLNPEAGWLPKLTDFEEDKVVTSVVFVPRREKTLKYKSMPY